MHVMHALAALPLPVTLGGALVLSVVLPWLAVRGARRLWPHPALKESNELVGFTFAVFGLIYGVLLAYTIVVAWERFSETERIVMREATVLSELWRDAQAFPAAEREPIQMNLVDYARSAVEDEWPAMAATGREHPRTTQIYDWLWVRAYHLNADTRGEQEFLSKYLDRMNDLSSQRRLRILYADMHVPPILWVVLFAGGIMTVAYTLLFSYKTEWVQITIVSFVTLMLLLSLVVIISLQFPFTGDVRVSPQPLVDLLESFHHRLRMMRF